MARELRTSALLIITLVYIFLLLIFNLAGIHAAYALSGGFKSWSLISENLARRLLQVERPIESVVGPFGAFRMMLVIDKATR